jgi:ribonuclease Z
MDLLFLGTSSGMPTKARNVTGLALIEDASSSWYLIDCGEGTQQQLLRTPLSLHQLQLIAITHVHGDHCYGLPGLLASAGMLGRKSPLIIIAPKAIEDWWNATVAHTQLFLPYEITFVAVETFTGWKNEVFSLDIIPLSHRVPSYAYRFAEINCASVLNVEKLQAELIPAGPLWGSLKRGEDVDYQGRILRANDYWIKPHSPRVLVIGGDNDKPELLTKACEDCQVLVHEATFTEEIALQVGAGKGHSYASQVAQFAQSAQIPNLVLTHFSARYQADISRTPSILDLENEARTAFGGKLFMAEDFARFRLEKSGRLVQVV